MLPPTHPMTLLIVVAVVWSLSLALVAGLCLAARRGDEVPMLSASDAESFPRMAAVSQAAGHDGSASAALVSARHLAA